MQAISLVDLFLMKYSGVEIEVLQLVGISALFIAVKGNEDRILSIAQCESECDGQYSIEQLQNFERGMLTLLEWKVNIPTPMDFL